MEQVVSHSWSEETLEAKARWFQSLTLTERMEILCAYYDLFLSVNPQIADLKNAQSTEGRILFLSNK